MFGKKYLSSDDAGQKIYRTLQAYKEGDIPSAIMYAANEGHEWEHDSKHNFFHVKRLRIDMETSHRAVLLQATYKDCALSFT